MRTAQILELGLVASLSLGASAQPGSHCGPAETDIWSCRAGAMVYSVCALRGIDQEVGHLQYRAGRPGTVQFQYPAWGTRPVDAFSFDVLPHGVSLSFNSGSYRYSITEDLKGETSVLVSGPGQQRTIRCAVSSHSLTLTTTIQLFESLGLKR